MALPRRELSPSEIKDSRYTRIKYSKQQALPSGTVAEFEWKDYCPTVFRNLQELGDIDKDDYLFGVCCYETLVEIFIRGKNSKPFCLPTDPRFVIKTLQKHEVKTLKEMLPDYFSHVSRYQETLLTKLYGLHSARPVLGGQKIYFVVMENLLNSELHMHKRYDLKGTRKGRTSSKTAAYQKITLKDLDFDLCFYIDPSIRNELLEQIKNDCKFLEEQGVMDYSLLLGIHILPRRGKGQSQCIREIVLVLDITHVFNIRDFIKQNGGFGVPESVKSAALQSSSPRFSGLSDCSYTNTFGETVECPVELSHKTGPTLADFFEAADRATTTSGIWSAYEGLGFKFGANFPARAMKKPKENNEISTPTPGTGSRITSQESREVLLFFGIIDFLQGYTVKKRLEHVYKSLQFNPRMIPAVKPQAYAARFQEFLTEMFLAEESLKP